MSKSVHIHVYGKVQGVFFRMETKNKAEEFDLKGIVKNLLDGSVEIIATGKENNLAKLIKWCYNGSKGANVKSVNIEWLDGEKIFDNFKIV